MRNYFIFNFRKVIWTSYVSVFADTFLKYVWELYCLWIILTTVNQTLKIIVFREKYPPVGIIRDVCIFASSFVQESFKSKVFYILLLNWLHDRTNCNFWNSLFVWLKGKYQKTFRGFWALELANLPLFELI